VFLLSTIEVHDSKEVLDIES